MPFPADIGAGDALIIVDVQNDFCPGGSLAVPEADTIIPAINRLQKDFAAAGATIVLTQDWHPAGHKSFASAHSGKKPFETTRMPYGEQVLWPDHCVQGSAGADFHPALATEPAHLIIRKGMNREVDSYSAFFENDRKTATGLAGALARRGVGRIFLCGIVAEFCVGYSALDGLAEGFATCLITDAIARFGGDDLAKMNDALEAKGASFITFA